jgi:hypothetical protein
MYHGHVLGHVVRQLRQMFDSGASASEIVAYLDAQTPGILWQASRTLRAAFSQETNWLTYALVAPRPFSAKLNAEILEKFSETRPTWEKRQFPELLCVRDYFSFLRFAKDEQVVIMVADARPSIGKPDASYLVHGVYDAETYDPVWTGKRGEKLRATLNRLLGKELVRVGPHDQWEHRNDRGIAGSLWGPQLPMLEFDSEEHINNVFGVEEMAFLPQYSDRWNQLYPHHRIEKGNRS